MILQVVADESYAVGREQHTVAIGGWLTTVELMESFCRSWATVLNNYHVDYFHFCEFADKRHKVFAKTIYDDLTDEQRESFLYELALVACELGVPVGGCDTFNGTKTAKAKAIFRAYMALFEEIKIAHNRWFGQDRTVEFIFDENDNPEWKHPLEDALSRCKRNGYPFKDRAFKNDTDFLPLQAADLRIYAVRQNAERYFKAGRQSGSPKILDVILDKNHYSGNNWQFTAEMWQMAMREMIAHSKQWKSNNPSQTYYPHKHWPPFFNEPKIN